MNGILLINKKKNETSRDVVNQVSHKLGIKKVGHAGTLDPLATGVLVIGVGKGTKILDLLTLSKKEYIATVKLGMETDTLDISGKILKNENINDLSKAFLKEALEHFQGFYEQTVPIYSAVKKNGKRLYEYARKQEDVDLPKRLVEILEIKLLNYDKKKQEFTFQTLVSKGTYIRSLIRDIGNYLKIPCTMKDLVRTKSGDFLLSNCQDVDEDFHLLKIKDVVEFPNIKIFDVNTLKRIRNGNPVFLKEQGDYILFIDPNDEELAVYKKVQKDEYHAYKVF